MSTNLNILDTSTADVASSFTIGNSQVSPLSSVVKDPHSQYLLMMALQQSQDGGAALNQLFGSQQHSLLMSQMSSAYLNSTRGAAAVTGIQLNNSLNTKFNILNAAAQAHHQQQQIISQQYQQVASAAAAAQQYQQQLSTSGGNNSTPMFRQAPTVDEQNASLLQLQQQLQVLQQQHNNQQHLHIAKQMASMPSIIGTQYSPLNGTIPTGGNQSLNGPEYVNRISEDSVDRAPLPTIMTNSTKAAENRSESPPLYQPFHQPTRILGKDERQRLLTEATDLTRQLLRINAILDIDTLVLTCDLQKGHILDRKANCAELLVAANELVELEHERNPIQLASDIFNGKRTIFPRQETIINSKPEVDGSYDPYRNIPTKHEIQRGDILREIASLYTSLYRKSPSNPLLSIKEATIGQVEDLMRNYHKDGYKLSPGIKAYLQSAISDRKCSLEDPIGEESLRPMQPICWDVGNVPYCIKSVVYKITDRRSSAEAKQRAKDLTIRRKQMKEGNLNSADKQEESSHGSWGGNKKRQRSATDTVTVSPANKKSFSLPIVDDSEESL